MITLAVVVIALLAIAALVPTPRRMCERCGARMTPMKEASVAAEDWVFWYECEVCGASSRISMNGYPND